MHKCGIATAKCNSTQNLTDFRAGSKLIRGCHFIPQNCLVLVLSKPRNNLVEKEQIQNIAQAMEWDHLRQGVVLVGIIIIKH